MYFISSDSDGKVYNISGEGGLNLGTSNGSLLSISCLEIFFYLELFSSPNKLLKITSRYLAQNSITFPSTHKCKLQTTHIAVQRDLGRMVEAHFDQGGENSGRVALEQEE